MFLDPLAAAAIRTRLCLRNVEYSLGHRIKAHLNVILENTDGYVVAQSPYVQQNMTSGHLTSL